MRRQRGLSRNSRTDRRDLFPIRYERLLSAAKSASAAPGSERDPSSRPPGPAEDPVDFPATGPVSPPLHANTPGGGPFSARPEDSSPLPDVASGSHPQEADETTVRHTPARFARKAPPLSTVDGENASARAVEKGRQRSPEVAPEPRRN